MTKTSNFITVVILFFLLISACERPKLKEQNMTKDKISASEELLKIVAYNLWANEQVINWLSTHSEDLLNQEVVSSFPSIRATVIHNWGAEVGWTSLLENNEWKNPFEGDEFTGNTKAALDEWRMASQQFNSFVKSADFNQINQKLASNNSGYTAEETIIHVANHATHHRGQIITMARTIGLTNPPRTDFIFYVKTVANNKLNT